MAGDQYPARRTAALIAVRPIRFDHLARGGSGARNARAFAAGIDMSLHAVGRLPGQEDAMKTARQMEYPWEPEGRSAGSHGRA